MSSTLSYAVQRVRASVLALIFPMEFNAFLKLVKKPSPVAPAVIRLSVELDVLSRRVLHDKDARLFDNYVILEIAVHQDIGNGCVVVKLADKRRRPAHGRWSSWYCMPERTGPDDRYANQNGPESEGTTGARDNIVFANTVDNLFAKKPRMKQVIWAKFTTTNDIPSVLNHTFSSPLPALPESGLYTPTLRHLARVALALHLTLPDYNPTLSNGYVFAHALFYLMIKLFPPLDGTPLVTYPEIPVGDVEMYERCKSTYERMDTSDFCEARENELVAAQRQYGGV